MTATPPIINEPLHDRFATEAGPPNHLKFAISNISNKCSLACWFESQLVANDDDSVSRETRPILANTFFSNEIRIVFFFFIKNINKQIISFGEPTNIAKQQSIFLKKTTTVHFVCYV